MLLLTASSSVARRIQGPWVAESEVRSVVAHWRRQHQPQYVEGIAGDGGPGAAAAGSTTTTTSCSSAAMELVVRSQLGSTSMLQRKLRVGFSTGRAADGPPRTAGGRGSVRGIQGPGRAHDTRGARAARRPVAGRGPTPRTAQSRRSAGGRRRRRPRRRVGADRDHHRRGRQRRPGRALRRRWRGRRRRSARPRRQHHRRRPGEHVGGHGGRRPRRHARVGDRGPVASAAVAAPGVGATPRVAFGAGDAVTAAVATARGACGVELVGGDRAAAPALALGVPGRPRAGGGRGRCAAGPPVPGGGAARGRARVGAGGGGDPRPAVAGGGRGGGGRPQLGITVESGPETPVPIASLTKIMTAYLMLRDHPLSPPAQGPGVTDDGGRPGRRGGRRARRGPPRCRCSRGRT